MARNSVHVTEREITFEGALLLPLPALAEQSRIGAGPDERHLGIPALTEILEQRAQSDAKAAASEKTVHLRLDPASPYRTLADVLFSFGARGFEAFELSVEEPGTPHVLSFSFRPASQGSSDDNEYPPFVNVWSRTTGFELQLMPAIQATGKTPPERPHTLNVGSGCRLGEPGLAVPALDHAGLDACLRKLRREVPELAGYFGIVLRPLPSDSALVTLQTIGTLQCGSAICLRSRSTTAERRLPQLMLGWPERQK